MLNGRQALFLAWAAIDCERKSVILRMLLVLACWMGTTALAETLIAYNSYLVPPFLYEEQRGGLAPDLVEYLNQRLAPAYQLKLENLPRARLDKLVLSRQGEKFAGIALFLHPNFVGDTHKRRYLWSQPLMGDRNLLVFHAPLPWPINSLEALNGMRFSGIYSHRYTELDERVGAGLLKREDAADESVNLGKVAARRVDFTQLNQSNFLALQQRHRDYTEILVAQPVPGQAPFNRYILVGRNNTALLKVLDKVIAGMASDPDWQRISHKYALPPPH